MNDNDERLEELLNMRNAPPTMREDLSAQIVRAALSQDASITNKRYIWFFNPRAYMALAACFVFALVMVSGVINVDGIGQDTYKTQGPVALASIDDNDIDVLYYWEDYYL